MPQILVFGDSTAHGSLDPAGGWVAHLNAYCERKALESPNYYFPVYNLGISGDVSTGLLRRFANETRVRIGEEKETIFIVQNGSNDAMYLKREKRNQISPEEFRSNMAKLVEAAQKFSGKIVFLGIKAVDEKRLNPIPWYKNGSYFNRYLAQYNKILQQVCRQAEIPFIDLSVELPADFAIKNMVDGVHPNTAGHKLIWEIVKKFLVVKRWI